MALPFPPVVTLDAAYGLLLEFVHVEYEIGHGNTSLYQWMSRSFCVRNPGHFFRLRGTKVENMFGFGWTSEDDRYDDDYRCPAVPALKQRYSGTSVKWSSETFQFSFQSVDRRF